MKRIVCLPWWWGCEDNWKRRLTAQAWADCTFVRAFAIAAPSKEWLWARNTHIILGIFSLLICKFHLTGSCTSYHTMSKHMKEAHCREAETTQSQPCKAGHLQRTLHGHGRVGSRPCSPDHSSSSGCSNRDVQGHTLSALQIFAPPLLPGVFPLKHKSYTRGHPALTKDCIKFSIQFSTGHYVPWAVRTGDQQKEVIPIDTWHKTSGKR